MKARRWVWDEGRSTKLLTIPCKQLFCAVCLEWKIPLKSVTKENSTLREQVGLVQQTSTCSDLHSWTF